MSLAYCHPNVATTIFVTIVVAIVVVSDCCLSTSITCAANQQEPGCWLNTVIVAQVVDVDTRQYR